MTGPRTATNDGRRMPKRAKPVTSTTVERSITAKVSPAVHAAVERLASSQGLTVSGWARAVIEAMVRLHNP
jgi:hypothetical protein